MPSSCPTSPQSPLHQLLEDKTPWSWTSECQAAFRTTKKFLTSARVLTHYHSSRPLRVECDTSSVRQGEQSSAMKCQMDLNGQWYVTSSAEKNYAQIGKGSTRFGLWREKVTSTYIMVDTTLVTDHKPLLANLGPKKAVPTLSLIHI